MAHGMRPIAAFGGLFDARQRCVVLKNNLKTTHLPRMRACDFYKGIKPHPSRDTSFSNRPRARCGNRFQKTETTPTKTARSAFFAKDDKNSSFEKRAKVKIKTLRNEYPISFLFTSKNDIFQAMCGLKSLFL
ncbi:MAG: hypothetical protein HQL86_02285 [Magnetococcales bacterium]|nr:hypothetical protein [Magnetococcales bacterium]